MSDTYRNLGADDSALIGQIIANAFADDPVNLWTFNGTAAMRPAFTAMAKYLFLRHGFGHVSDSGLAGTLWLPPGATKNYGAKGNLALASAILSHGGLKALRRGMVLDANLMAKHPSCPHYYLFAIGVDPSLQGAGVGSTLMKMALQEVDSARMPAFLENSKPRNTPFYERHGFRVTEEIIPAHGCPPMWLMWRDAR
ncbi:MAG: GNAT family N-acetyltransferase [Alphaproteobacteria bacterium]|nr:GNAT family N-acetyltransferase [Alphaproteobacteria bacterium]